MRHTKVLGILSLLAALVLLTVLLPLKPALAQTISISPTSGPVGTRVLVNGITFTPGSTYQIFYGSSQMKSGIVAAGGNFADSFIVPPSPAGTTEVWVQTFTEFNVTNFTVVSNVTLSAYSAGVGQTITVNGTGFSANKSVTIIFDDGIIGTALSNAQGSITTTFTVPESSRGSHTVKAADANNNSDTVSLTTTELIAITPNSGTAGTEVSVSGSSFTASRSITITYDGVRVATAPATITTDSKGKFNAKFAAPASSSGTHRLEVSDGTYKKSATFTVSAKGGLSTPAGYVGDEVTINGSGFKANQSVTVTFANIAIKTISTDAAGSFQNKFMVPPMSGGAYEVKATDGSNTITAQFTIQVSAKLSSPSGYPGMALTVSGSGFTGTVTVKYDNVEMAKKPAEANGSFTATFTVPSSTAGSHTVTASDGTSTATAEFAIKVSANLSQTSGHVGMALTISGTGFAGAVTVKYDNVEMAKKPAGADGSFTVTFTVPASTAGSHTVTASDEMKEAKATFTMESQAPPVPEPVSPESETKADAEAQFQWTKVTDISGVQYALQIATSASFTPESILLDKKGIAEATYTLTQSQKLESTKKDAPYYWRVKAVDGASNESAWSAPSTFYVGGFPLADLPDWAKNTLIGVGVFLIGLLGFWLGRRTAYY